MDKRVIDFNKIKVHKGGIDMTTATIRIKPIKATPTVEGKFAKAIIAEALSKPSESAIKRNEDALALLRKLKG